MKGSYRSSRCKHDFQAISDVVSNIDNSVPETSVRDCSRLGKYHEAKSRPILVKLTRTSDVQSILANRAKLANMPGISIKPDMTQEQRKTYFMKERSSFKMVLTKKKIIKLRGNCICVQGQKHGSVTNFVFKAKVSPPQTTSNTTDSEPDSQWLSSALWNTHNVTPSQTPFIDSQIPSNSKPLQLDCVETSNNNYNNSNVSHPRIPTIVILIIMITTQLHAIISISEV